MVLDHWTLPALLAAWVDALQWHREQDARQLELLAAQMELQAAFAQIKEPGKTVAHLREQAAELRRSPFAEERRRRLSPANRAFVGPVLAQLSPEQRARWED